MKIIEKLSDRIDEEIGDVKYYAKLATEVKAEWPGLANVLYNISVQEDTHQAALHAEVVKLIEAHRKTHGEPPAAMMDTKIFSKSSKTAKKLTSFLTSFL